VWLAIKNVDAMLIGQNLPSILKFSHAKGRAAIITSTFWYSSTQIRGRRFDL
jgi:hypothetical protein